MSQEQLIDKDKGKEKEPSYKNPLNEEEVS